MDTIIKIGADSSSYSIRSLIDVHFVTATSGTDTGSRYVCPSCKKGLNSVGKLYSELIVSLSTLSRRSADSLMYFSIARMWSCPLFRMCRNFTSTGIENGRAR